MTADSSPPALGSTAASTVAGISTPTSATCAQQGQMHDEQELEMDSEVAGFSFGTAASLDWSASCVPSDRPDLPPYQLPEDPATRTQELRRWVDVLHDAMLDGLHLRKGTFRFEPVVNRFVYAYRTFYQERSNHPNVDFFQRELIPTFKAILSEPQSRARQTVLNEFFRADDMLEGRVASWLSPCKEGDASKISASTVPLPDSVLDLLELFLRCISSRSDEACEAIYIASAAARSLRHSLRPGTSTNLAEGLRALCPLLRLLESRRNLNPGKLDDLDHENVGVEGSSDASTATSQQRKSGKLIGVSKEQFRSSRSTSATVERLIRRDPGVNGEAGQKMRAGEIAYLIPIRPSSNAALFLAKRLLVLAAGITPSDWMLNSPSNMVLLSHSLHACVEPGSKGSAGLAFIPTDETLDLLLRSVIPIVEGRSLPRRASGLAGRSHQANSASIWAAIEPLLSSGKVAYDLLNFSVEEDFCHFQVSENRKECYLSSNEDGLFYNNCDGSLLPLLRFARIYDNGNAALPRDLPNPLLVCIDLCIKLYQRYPDIIPSPPPGYLSRFVKVVQLVWAVFQRPTCADQHDSCSPKVGAGHQGSSVSS